MNQKHYKNSLLLLCMGVAFGSQAQHNNEFYNKGAVVHIESGAEVHVIGDVHMYEATGRLENYGLLKADGDMYSDNLFQQRGTGTTRLQNNLANAGQVQKISGSYAVRGASSANKGVDDGSFYTLELANDQGIVWLETSALTGNTPYVADVRNGVDFWYGATQNRIVTMQNASVVTNSTDGWEYTAMFGIMNPNATQSMAWAPGGMLDNTVQLNNGMSPIDAGYVQGKFRRQIAPAGGDYPFIIGLEPNGAGAQRGMQYIRLNFGPNDYDVIESYFDYGMDNSAVIGLIECVNNWEIDYAGGADHGQWIFNDPVPNTGGTYSATVWPQDHNFNAESIWFVTKDNAIQGTADECTMGVYPPNTGLTRTGFNGFSSLGVAASVTLLETKFMDIHANAIENKFIRVDWSTSKEIDLDHFVVERSLDDANFQPITTHPAVGNSTVTQTYHIDDYAVLPNVNYYYRVKAVSIDGSVEYTNSAVASLVQEGNVEDVRVFPNPVKGNQVTIEITAAQDRDVRFVVYDAIGQRIHQSSATMSVGLNQYTLYTKDWPSGAYFIHITGEDFSSIQELIKRQD